MKLFNLSKFCRYGAAVMTTLTLLLSGATAQADSDISDKAQPKLAFYVEFHLKPEFVEQWKQGALEVLNKMSKEDTFVSAYMHINANDPTKYTLYEVWSEPSREAFFENQLNSKEYRAEYEKNLPQMLQSPRVITFLDLLDEWHQ